MLTYAKRSIMSPSNLTPFARCVPVRGHEVRVVPGVDCFQYNNACQESIASSITPGVTVGEKKIGGKGILALGRV